MQIIDLFSGIGGFSLAGRWAGYKTVQFCEIDLFCQSKLRKNFPGVPIHDDIKTLECKKIKIDRSKPSITVGGFPCQGFSTAGKRKGEEDDRFLWPQMLRTIREIKPTYVLAENVLGIISISNGLVFERVQTDLEDAGYEVLTFILPVIAVGGIHERQRVWFVAHSKCGNAQNRYPKYEILGEKIKEQPSINANGYFDLPSWGKLQNEDRVCRIDDGLSRGVDRINRLKALGNAVNPHIVYQIFKAINEYEQLNKQS